MKDFVALEKQIGVKFRNHNLLKQAFVHRSYVNENKKYSLGHNERLEFLGDAVLELAVTKYLYLNYENPEGELTNWRAALVKGEMLAKISEKMGFEDYLFLSRGESRGSRRARNLILANTFEAVLGAIYIDQGFDVSEEFVNKFLIIELPEILDKETYIDAKTKLQEYFQDKDSVTPEYFLLEESGPDHKKYFKMGVRINGKEIGKGEGESKQSAEQDSAKNALKKIKI